jgi:acetyltransferase-like isoleucine patch superfamily enzyme
MKQTFKKIVRFFYHKLYNRRAFVDFNSTVSLDCRLGEFVKIFPGAKLGSCTIARCTYLTENCNITRTKIGPFTSIGPEVLCGLGKHPVNYVSTYPGFYSDKVSGSKWFEVNHPFGTSDKPKVTIGADVWIGARAIIIGGITIGHGAVIAAGAVVTKDIQPYAIVGGVPAKLIRFRFEKEVIEKLLDSKWWELPEEQLRSAAQFIQSPDLFLDYLNSVTKRI